MTQPESKYELGVRSEICNNCIMGQALHTTLTKVSNKILSLHVKLGQPNDGLEAIWQINMQILDFSLTAAKQAYCPKFDASSDQVEGGQVATFCPKLVTIGQGLEVQNKVLDNLQSLISAKSKRSF